MERFDILNEERDSDVISILQSFKDDPKQAVLISLPHLSQINDACAGFRGCRGCETEGFKGCGASDGP